MTLHRHDFAELRKTAPVCLIAPDAVGGTIDGIAACLDNGTVRIKLSRADCYTISNLQVGHAFSNIVDDAGCFRAAYVEVFFFVSIVSVCGYHIFGFAQCSPYAVIVDRSA